MTNVTQISAGLSGRSVSLHGVSLPLESLCGGNFIVGATGSGKSETVVEPLALALAKDRMDSPAERSAIVFFGAKGSGHKRFLEKLPKERTGHVIRISADSKNFFALFHSRHWKGSRERIAVVPFILELTRHAANCADESGNHKSFFEGTLENALATLSEAAVQRGFDWKQLAQNDPSASRLFHADALTALVRRIEAAVHYVAVKANQTTDAQSARSTVFERWLALLHGHFQGRIRAMLPQLVPTNPTTGAVLLSELNAIARLFRSGPARDLLLGNLNPIAGTWERVIDEGLVVIVDLPAAGSPENRMCLIALAQSLMGAILRRASARIADRPLNQLRPVIIVADEFHSYLCSKGRHDGLDRFLGSCREFGAIALLATQSLSQLHNVFGDWMRTESLLGHTRHVFLGASTCSLTCQWAERICGTKSAGSRPLMIDWHQDPAVAALVDTPASEEPRVLSRNLAQLRTGIFYVKAPDGRLLHVDARRELPEPRITQV